LRKSAALLFGDAFLCLDFLLLRRFLLFLWQVDVTTGFFATRWTVLVDLVVFLVACGIL
jgi:hypothetical protein